MSTTKIFPCALLQLITIVEEGLEKAKNDPNSFNKYTNNLKEGKTYIKDQNNKPKQQHRNYKNSTTVSQTVDIFVLVAPISISVRLSALVLH